MKLYFAFLLFVVWRGCFGTVPGRFEGVVV